MTISKFCGFHFGHYPIPSIRNIRQEFRKGLRKNLENNFD